MPTIFRLYCLFCRSLYNCRCPLSLPVVVVNKVEEEVQQHEQEEEEEDRHVIGTELHAQVN